MGLAARSAPVAGALAIALLAVAAARTLVACSDRATGGGACTSDQDGVVGGTATFDLTVDDTAFSPTILKAQNRAQVTLTLRNNGTKPHDFTVGCIATPNGNGCPTTSCFGDGGSIAAVAPGQSATTVFVTPNPEGIYAFRSDLPGDPQPPADGGAGGLAGQFIVQ